MCGDDNENNNDNIDVKHNYNNMKKKSAKKTMMWMPQTSVNLAYLVTLDTHKR